MAGKLVVPSDVTLLEEKYATGVRRLGIFEKTGLLLTPPLWHIRYTKNNTSELRDVLKKKYSKDSTDPVVLLLKARQESVRKQVVAQNGMWLGVDCAALAVIWGLRHYNYQAKAMALPFACYFGSFVGRAFGNLATNRNKEYGRDRYLGQLPAHQFFNPSAAEA